eukprot:sb/3468705/
MLLLLALLAALFSTTTARIISYPLPQSKENYIRLDINEDVAWQEFTVAGWVNYTTDKRPAIFSYAKKGLLNEMVLWFQTDCEFRLTVGGSQATTTSLCGEVQLGEWIHLAGVWSSATGEVRGYVNGELVVNKTRQIGYEMKNEGILIIGQDQDSYGGGFQNTQAFAGELADLFWLRTALTPDQVVALYTGSLSPESFTGGDFIVSWQDILSAPSYGAEPTETNKQPILIRSVPASFPLHEIVYIRVSDDLT